VVRAARRIGGGASAVEDAVLFRLSDEPVMSRLGFLRVAD
jgi:hypothetical protein